MRRADLIESMSEMQKILLLNKEAMPLPLIAQVDEMLAKLKEPNIRSALSNLFGVSIETVLTSLEKVLEIEKKLLLHTEGEPCLSDRIHQSLGSLQNRPIVLSAIAACI